MGHTIHLFFPETWGFHIDLVTEDNVVAPLSIKVSSHSLDTSQNSSLMYDAFRFFLSFFLLYDSTELPAIVQLSRKPHWLFPACFLSSLRVKLGFLTCFFETSLFIIRLQISNNQELQCKPGRITCCYVAVPETSSTVFLCWPAIIGLWLTGRCWVSWVQICSITYSI